MDHPTADIDRALDLLRKLPADRQKIAADFIEDLATSVEPWTLSPEELAICEAALAGPIATAAEVDDVLNRPW